MDEQCCIWKWLLHFPCRPNPYDKAAIKRSKIYLLVSIFLNSVGFCLNVGPAFLIPSRTYDCCTKCIEALLCTFFFQTNPTVQSLSFIWVSVRECQNKWSQLRRNRRAQVKLFGSCSSLERIALCGRRSKMLVSEFVEYWFCLAERLPVHPSGLGYTDQYPFRVCMRKV